MIRLASRALRLAARLFGLAALCVIAAIALALAPLAWARLAMASELAESIHDGVLRVLLRACDLAVLPAAYLRRRFP